MLRGKHSFLTYLYCTLLSYMLFLQALCPILFNNIHCPLPPPHPLVHCPLYNNIYCFSPPPTPRYPLYNDIHPPPPPTHWHVTVFIMIFIPPPPPRARYPLYNDIHTPHGLATLYIMIFIPPPPPPLAHYPPWPST